MSDVSEYLAIYLLPPGSVPGIGIERGKTPVSGVGRYKSPHGSVRYVLYERGTPIAALQVVSRDGKRAIIANAYEAHLSEAGRAWRDQERS